MDSTTETTITKPSPKPLGLLGRDEMNLAEFPITLLTDRVPKDQKEAIYQDEIYDERTGLTLTRKLTIQAGNHGLTTAVDDEVILRLIQLTKKNNNFTKRKVDFSRHELIQATGLDRAAEPVTTGSCCRSNRWTSVYLAVRKRMAGQPHENLDHRRVSTSLISLNLMIAGRPANSSS